MATLDKRYTINGVMDTDRTVNENLESLALNSGCWISYDVLDGLWSVIINKSGNSVFSFDDSNIIGPIDFSTTALSDLFNSVKVTFPRADLNDQEDFVNIEIPDQQRLPNEPENTLELDLEFCNNPVQAKLLGLLELRQSRQQTILTFTSDYTAISVNAGDIIDITNSALGFDSKLFRVISVREADGDDGSIGLEFTALEYSEDVYDTSDLSKFTITNENGIVTIGDIGTPNEPLISRIERDSRPRIIIESSAPNGIVEGMEFWYSDSGNNFVLLGSERPDGGGSYDFNETVVFDFDGANQGNVFVKTRAFNSTTTGDFSPVAASTYTPVQTTQAIDPNTDVVDENNNSLLGLLGANALLALLNGLLENRDTSEGSLFDTIFDIFSDDTGVDIRQPENIGENIQLDNLADVEVSTAVSDQVLQYDGTNWVSATVSGTGGATELNQLNDVVLDSPSEDEVLRYDGNEWVNGPDLWQGSRKFVSSSEPSNPNEGDIWFEI